MPNIAVVLKEEIARLARKEIRAQTQVVRKASAQHRRDIAELKRQVAELQKGTAILKGCVLTEAPAAPPPEAVGKSVRITAKGIRSLRKTMGVTAAELAALVDVSPQSIYNWESDKSSPRKEQAAQLVGLRGIGKKEARARVEQLVKPAAAKA